MDCTSPPWSELAGLEFKVTRSALLKINVRSSIAMKYWETFFLTVGAGRIVGASITRKSWLAIPLGFLSAIWGYALHVWRENERRNN